MCVKIVQEPRTTCERHWVCVERDLYIREKRPIFVQRDLSQNRPKHVKGDLYLCKNSPTTENYIWKINVLPNSGAIRQWVYVKRDMYMCEKRPIYVWKETYMCVKIKILPNSGAIRHWLFFVFENLVCIKNTTCFSRAQNPVSSMHVCIKWGISNPPWQKSPKVGSPTFLSHVESLCQLLPVGIRDSTFDTNISSWLVGSLKL